MNTINLENSVRQYLSTILPTYTQLEGHLILYDPLNASRMSLFFREDDPRPPSNTSTASFPTPNSKGTISAGTSSGENSPLGSNGHRRKPLHPTRLPLDQQTNHQQQDAPLNLSLATGVATDASIAADACLPSRELFPPSLFSSLVLQQHLNLLASQQQSQQSPPPVLPFETFSSPPAEVKPAPKSTSKPPKTPKLSVLASPSGVRKPRQANGSSTPGTPGKSRRFSCNQCGNEFVSLATLSDHTSSVHGTYRCSLCPTEFTQRSNLQRHALKHIGFKPFECRVCGRAYYRKDHLARHVEQTHPGIEPRSGIQVKLSASESLNYIEKMMKTDGGASLQMNIAGDPGMSDDARSCCSGKSISSEEERVRFEPGTVFVKPEHTALDDSMDDMDIDIVH